MWSTRRRTHCRRCPSALAPGRLTHPRESRARFTMTASTPAGDEAFGCIGPKLHAPRSCASGDENELGSPAPRGVLDPAPREGLHLHVVLERAVMPAR